MFKHKQNPKFEINKTLYIPYHKDTNNNTLQIRLKI